MSRKRFRFKESEYRDEELGKVKGFVCFLIINNKRIITFASAYSIGFWSGHPVSNRINKSKIIHFLYKVYASSRSGVDDKNILPILIIGNPMTNRVTKKILHITQTGIII
jgi:hypothetical protein